MYRLRVHPGYLLVAIILFITEVLIALYVKDAIVRPYVGDFLVVILLYCVLRAFVAIPVAPAALAVLLLACFIEFLQYVRLVEILGWQTNYLARVILGVSFEWLDMLAYTLGVAAVWVIERGRGQR